MSYVAAGWRIEEAKNGSDLGLLMADSLARLEWCIARVQVFRTPFGRRFSVGFN